jgi:hypothetical protein
VARRTRPQHDHVTTQRIAADDPHTHETGPNKG